MTKTTTYAPRKTNHVLHLILSFLTCGLWLFVWPCVWAFNTMTKQKTTTYQEGQPWGYSTGSSPGAPNEPASTGWTPPPNYPPTP